MVRAHMPPPCPSSIEGEETLPDLGRVPPVEVGEGQQRARAHRPDLMGRGGGSRPPWSGGGDAMETARLEADARGGGVPLDPWGRRG